jgi:ABC-type branched-subunit amino acid transport system ATPase component
MSALLSVADAHVAYGKVEAVRSVSLEVGSTSRTASPWDWASFPSTANCS